MSFNPGHARYLRRPRPPAASPLERAILRLEQMIEARRLNALPVPFDLYRAKRILERSRQNRLSVEVEADTGAGGEFPDAQDPQECQRTWANTRGGTVFFLVDALAASSPIATIVV